MAGMKKGPIGVWFSVALVILVSSAWVGSKAGSKIAQLWESHQRQKQGMVRGPNWAHVESTLSELNAIHTLQLYAFATHDNRNAAKKYVLNEIRGLETLKRRSGAGEIGPVIDIYPGLAFVYAAMAEEQDNNKELATKYMNSAQTLFRSLGWRDYSQETLKVVAERELDRWIGHPQTRLDGK
jgi:hypothetical protein